MQKKVLIAFDDPGGGLAVITVVERLMKEKDLKLKVYAGKMNEKILKEKKIESTLIDSMIEKGLAEKIINQFSPDLLITGTSGGNAEQELRNIAKEKNLQSVVILDFWKDYARRWMYASYPIDKLHDKVCVMDDETKKEMMEEKFPEEKLIVTGNPYLDKIFNYDGNDAHEDYDESVRNNFLFLSQPLKIIGIENYDVHPLEILLQVLEEISLLKKQKINLIIKLHPGEKKLSEVSKLSELSDLVRKYDSENLNVRISEDQSLNNLLKDSGTVIGFNTIAMFESRSMGKRTISLNVVPVMNSLTKAMNTAGIEIIDLDKNEIQNSLLEKYQGNKRENIFQGGIENCTRVIMNELNLN